MLTRLLAPCVLVLFIAGCGAAAPPGKSAMPQPPAVEPEPAGALSESPAPEAKTGKKAEDEPRGGAAPSAAQSEPLGGTLSQADIRAVVLKNAELFDPCYSIGAGKSQQFVATVTIKATLGPSGIVNLAEVTKSTAKNKKVDNCVADAFKKIKFPAPKGGATSVITFPMEFNGAEEVAQ